MRVRSRPVFFDPAGRRARTTNAVVTAAALLTFAGAGLALFSILSPPFLPSLPRHGPSARETPLPAFARVFEPSFMKLRDRSLPASAGRVERLAFFDSHDRRSFEALKRNSAGLDGIIANWLLLSDASGDIGLADVAGESEVHAWLRTEARHVKVYAQLTSRLRSRDLAAALATSARRVRLADGIAAHLRAQGYEGIALSLHQVPASSHTHLVSLIVALRKRLHLRGQKVIMVVPPSDGIHRYHELGRVADYLLLGTHDSSYGRHAPGPLASQGWFEAQLEKRLADVDRRKLIIGIGSFAYDWGPPGRPRPISVQEAWNLAAGAGSGLAFDKEALNPGFAYLDGERRRHDVWLLDGVSVFNQARTALATSPAALALWRLGLEDPSAWAAFGQGRRSSAWILEELRRPQAGLGVATDATGDAFAVEAEQRPGRRALDLDQASTLIVRQRMEQLPSAHRIASWGTRPANRIALTFDDGPDNRITPRILDVLHEKGVKATFFVVGRSAVRHPHLIRRIYDEGHDIGNHTFTHPDLVFRPPGEIEVELNATQRVLESQLGVRSILFRPPYAYHAYGSDPGTARVVETATALGYVTARVSIDPKDWTNITPRQIEERVIQGAAESKEGHIVLLHDGGGNRNPTLQALPGIIDNLRAQDFRFVTMHEILDKKREEVMPRAHSEGLLATGLAQATWIGVSALSWILVWLPLAAIATAILGGFRLALVIGFACQHGRREARREGVDWKPPSLAVLVPAYNEEKVICATIRSLLSSDGADLDIIVVDDGSSDRTAEIARRAFSDNNRVRVFKKENGGKAAALNFALLHTSAEVVVAIDADTVMAEDAIRLLVRHFEDTAVGAVAGTAVVGNQITLMARFQALEYVTSQNLDRRAFECVNAIGVVPGAIGAWRREALVQVGGYAHDTLAEDADVTIAIERSGWKILYEPRAIAFTEAPETVRAFLKQRFRWMFGTLQVAFKHAGALLVFPPTGVGLVTLPNIIVFQFAFTLLAPVMDLLLVLSLLLGLREWLAGSGFDVPENLVMVGRYWLLFQLIDMLAAVAGLKLGGDLKSWRLLPLVLLQRFSYRQLLYYVAVRTLLAAVKGRLVGWGKLLRTGNAATPAAAHS